MIFKKGFIKKVTYDTRLIISYGQTSVSSTKSLLVIRMKMLIAQFKYEVKSTADHIVRHVMSNTTTVISLGVKSP